MKGNILGDIRAENDSEMLDKAFLETADYKSLLESTDRCVIVGRRGTGKSALVHKLDQYWHNKNDSNVLIIVPEEDQIIGLRTLLKAFGDNFVYIKAGAKIAWRYALYMEILSKLHEHYKLRKLIEQSTLKPYLNEWSSSPGKITTNLRKILRKVINKDSSSEDNIADLSSNLNMEEIEIGLTQIIEDSGRQFILLIDRLDEGYTPDDTGVALLDGFVQAIIDLNAKFSNNVRGLVFLRDNIYRSIVIKDPDFTRNIEGQVLRLHWDDYGLFNMVCNRLRIAHDNNQENNVRLWNQYAARELRGRDGFKLTLRLTLYRPRDILVLLNNSFIHVKNQDRGEIVLDDIESSAKSISENRLYDLLKEYETIFPALNIFISAFSSGNSEILHLNAGKIINALLSKDDYEIVIQRDIVFFENPEQVLQRLYGIGFIGIYDEKASSYVFCHDGRDPAKEILEDSKLLIHPCYWLALNLKENAIDGDQAEEIYDEYDIEISSISEDQRQKRIGQIIEEIKGIEPGQSDCHTFEDWCLQAIKLIFAGVLTNIELHANKNGRQQRDIIATNMATILVWDRIFQDYGTRQVIFEIKNYADLQEEDYK